MNQRWRITLFVALGLALLLAGLGLALRGHGFGGRESAWLRFNHSVYGLQVGAPVVLRGVPLGQVRDIGLAPADATGLNIPVRVDLDQARLRELLGPAGGGVAELVRRGLVGRLATQSLLTGQLYIDLDLDPGRAASGPALPTLEGPEIPTQASQLQDLQAQLKDLDLAQLGRDLAAAAAAARQLLGQPELASNLTNTLKQTQAAASAMARLAQHWEAQSKPLTSSALATLESSRQTLAQLQHSMSLWNGSLSRLDGLAQQAQPLIEQSRQSAQALTDTALAWRELAAEDASLRQQTERALQDVSQAARAMRDLSELLDRRPDAWWRGRATAAEDTLKDPP